MSYQRLDHANSFDDSSTSAMSSSQKRPSTEEENNAGESMAKAHDEPPITNYKESLPIDGPDQNNITDASTLGSNIDSNLDSPDLWSVAYQEAVESLGNDIDVAILKGKNVTRLLRELEEIDKEATKGSAFLRGVEYLRSIQVPLERFKLALDLASPLTSIEPSSAAAFGVVSGVTAVRLSRKNITIRSWKWPGYMSSVQGELTSCRSDRN